MSMFDYMHASECVRLNARVCVHVCVWLYVWHADTLAVQPA